MRTRRLLATAIAVSATLTLAAGTATGAIDSWTVRFSFVPQRVYQGQPAAISVLLNPAATKCTLLVRYVDGTAETGVTATRSVGGRVEWKWNVGDAAPAGAAKATVHCNFRSINVSRTFTVVGGTVRHSKLSIVNTGYSQRPDRFGSGSSVSVGAIGAASTFNLGGSQSLSSQTPVVKLEVVVQTDAFVKRSLHRPAIENIHIVPSAFEPTWVGEVDGDIVNDHPTDTLTNAQTYIVLFDSAGHVVGGGTGFLLATLPPGTRAYHSASFGFAAVPIEKATTAAVSIVPTYKAPGS
jgi:hypothetical protein